MQRAKFLPFCWTITGVLCWLNEYTEGAEALASDEDRISAMDITDGYLAIFGDALGQDERNSEGKQVGDYGELRENTFTQHAIPKYHSLVCYI